MKLILPSGDCSAILKGWLGEYGARHNVVIEGQGAGLSFSNTPVHLTGMRPTVRGLTIEAPGTCLALINPGESICDDVWTYSKAGGLNVWCGITEVPAITSYGDYYTPKRGREEDVVVKRAFNCTFRDCFAFGDGDGWLLGSDFDWFAPRKRKERHIGFANHFRFFGGETYVKGMAMRWRWLKSSVFFGHHVDAWPYNGLDIGEGCEFNQWIGDYIEPNFKARQEQAPIIIGAGLARHGSIYPTPANRFSSWELATTGKMS